MYLTTSLSNWAETNLMMSPGAICVALVVTRHAIERGMPLNAAALLNGKSGEIRCLGKRLVQSILADYGVTRILASAGGRTSRGNVRKMRAYVDWLNANVHSPDFDLAVIEEWWVNIAKVTPPFCGKLRFRIDPNLSLRTTLRGLLGCLARLENGMCFRDTMMRHLVGAKLELMLGYDLQTHRAFAADSVTDRQGDFKIEDVVIHVTTSPGEGLLRKCVSNLDQGLRPLIITSFKNVVVAETLAENAGVVGRVEIFDVEQFLASNILELSKFKTEGQRITVHDLVKRYNKLADCENNPGILIHAS
ncbi:MAG: DUF4928 family protein [bacterium]